MTEQLDISKKPKTKLLQKLLDDLVESVVSLKERVLAVYNQARCEDYTPWEARELIENTIEISARYLRSILPEEALHKEKQHLYLNHDEELVPHNSLNTTSAYDYDPNTVTITTKHDVIDPYEESQDRIDDLIKETQDKQLKPITDKLSDLGYDLDPEDLQIQINDLTTQLENERSERIRISQLLDKEREKNKDPNFTPASELVKPATNPDDDTSPVLRSVYKKTIGELNTRILELKDQLNKVQKYDEVIEIKNQKIALVIEAANLKSVTVDEAKSRRLN
ncbi:MAG: hypothetical protein CV087_23285 [Candidatus Brocadia sp. WS118]|nr:MAG: hypothetical protein CV087_23285 [Candidatus Brocadia sp. WS118]